jgi:hypothetical protein
MNKFLRAFETATRYAVGCDLHFAAEFVVKVSEIRTQILRVTIQVKKAMVRYQQQLFVTKQ